MAVKNPKALVIDADIAQSAGGENAIYPVPKQCRDFLKEILATGHKMVMTPAIRVEWDEHQSSFARLWRTQMETRKRITRFGYNDDNITDEDLRNDIKRCAPDSNACQTMLKDTLLVEAAFAAEQTVTSQDERVRGLFSKASQQIIRLRRIVWVNPTKNEEGCIIWLRQGAPSDNHRKLGKEWENS